MLSTLRLTDSVSYVHVPVTQAMKRSPHATFFTETSDRLSMVRATNVGGSVTLAFLVSPSVEKVLVPNTPDAACIWQIGKVHERYSRLIEGIRRFICRFKI